MARKSRKEMLKIPVPIQASPLKKEVLPTGAYCRLSVENGGGEDTMDTQVELVTNYISQHPELELTETYIDVKERHWIQIN